jgi:DNA-binding MarR family transcriptional regulator
MSDELGFLIADAARLMRRAFDTRVRSRGVTRPQWRVLGLLSRYEGSSQSALAEMMDVEPITLARMIDRLAESGLVERKPDPNDRRAWRLFLTPLGTSNLEQLKPDAVALFDDALSGLSSDERVKLEAMLNVIRSNLSRRPAEVANG